MSNSDWKDEQLEPPSAEELRELSRAFITSQAREILRLQRDLARGEVVIEALREFLVAGQADRFSLAVLEATLLQYDHTCGVERP